MTANAADTIAASSARGMCARIRCRCDRSQQRAANGRADDSSPGPQSGPAAYKPYAQDTDTEIADKALAGETYTESHYERQAQRFLGPTVRALGAAGLQVSPASLSTHLKVGELDLLARDLPDDHAQPLRRYVNALRSRQVRELAGMRDRLAILAEPDLGRWLEPQPSHNAIDLRSAVAHRDIVLFSLEADRRPLAADLLGVAFGDDALARTCPLAVVRRGQRHALLLAVGCASCCRSRADQPRRLCDRFPALQARTEDSTRRHRRLVEIIAT